MIFRRERDEEYFLLLRYGFGHWGFAKGNIETGETEVEAAIREVAEETGITALRLIDDFRCEIEYFYRKMGATVHKRVTYFLAETAETDVKLSSEHEEYRWLTFYEALKQLSFSNDRKVLKKAWETIKNTATNNPMQLPTKSENRK